MKEVRFVEQIQVDFRLIEKALASSMKQVQQNDPLSKGVNQLAQAKTDLTKALSYHLQKEACE